MSLVRLYGRKAATFHHGKTAYIAGNGHVDLPSELVERAIAIGFVRQNPTPPEAVGDEPVAIALPPAPATQIVILPPDHPQAIEMARIAAKEAAAAAASPQTAQ